MKAYLQLLLDTFGWKIPVFLGLLMSLALIQGIGIAMLMPLLDLLGDAKNDVSGISSIIIQAMNYIGLEMTLASILSLYLVLMIFNAGLKVLIQSFDKRLQHTLTQKLKTDFLALITHCQWTYYQQLRQADLHHTLTRDISQINHGFYLVVAMTSTVIVTSIYILLALQISASITVLTSACGLLLLLGLQHKVKQAKKIGEKQFSSSRQYHSITAEHLENMKLVKSFGLENKHLAHFSKVIRKMMQHQLDHFKNGLFTKFYYELGGAIALCGIIYGSVIWFQLSISELVVLILIFSRLSPRFQQFQTQLQHFVRILPIHRAFVEQTKFLQQHQSRSGEHSHTQEFKDSIAVKGLYFRYPGKNNEDGDNYVLSDINLKILPHQTTAIIGPSGAGKSTLIDLLTGLLSPTKGSVNIDGQPLDPGNLSQWRQRLAYVTQDVMLFNDTLRNNLTWMTAQADDELIWQALSHAAADSIVKSLPQGLDTQLGDKGIVLSGGEKQRIALARALICEPEILILDEATSALDSENDAFIQQTIKQFNGKMTIIVIAHRLSSIQYADHIIVLKHGRIVEAGDWQSLINQQGSYLSGHINEKLAPHIY